MSMALVGVVIKSAKGLDYITGGLAHGNSVKNIRVHCENTDTDFESSMAKFSFNVTEKLLLSYNWEPYDCSSSLQNW